MRALNLWSINVCLSVIVINDLPKIGFMFHLLRIQVNKFR